MEELSVFLISLKRTHGAKVLSCANIALKNRGNLQKTLSRGNIGLAWSWIKMFPAFSPVSSNKESCKQTQTNHKKSQNPFLSRGNGGKQADLRPAARDGNDDDFLIPRKSRIMMSKSRLDGLQVISYFRPHFTPHPIHPAPNVGQMTGNCITWWAWVLMQENLMPINVSPNKRQLSFHLFSSHLVKWRSNIQRNNLQLWPLL